MSPIAIELVAYGGQNANPSYRWAQTDTSLLPNNLLNIKKTQSNWLKTE